jgi:hypothetical protein
MRTLIFLLALSSTPAFAWGHTPVAAPAVDGSPRAAGAELETLSEADLLKLKVLQLEEAVETLQHNLLASQMAGGQCQAQLIQCTVPAVEQHERDAAADRAARKETIRKAYGLGDKDQVNPDGTIVRGKVK